MFRKTVKRNKLPVIEISAGGIESSSHVEQGRVEEAGSFRSRLLENSSRSRTWPVQVTREPVGIARVLGGLPRELQNPIIPSNFQGGEAGTLQKRTIRMLVTVNVF